MAVEEEVAPAPTLRSVLVRARERALWDGIVPLLAFLVLNLTAGLTVAIAVSTAWTCGLAVHRRLRGRTVNALAWVVLAYVLARGVLAAALHSKLVYFGPALVNQGLLAVGFVVSAAVGRPAVGYIGQLVYPFPASVRAHRAHRTVFTRLTLLWGGYLALATALHAYLLLDASTTAYLLGRALITWPAALALFVFSLRYPRRVLRREPELAGFVAAAEALQPRLRTAGALSAPATGTAPSPPPA